MRPIPGKKSIIISTYFLFLAPFKGLESSCFRFGSRPKLPLDVEAPSFAEDPYCFFNLSLIKTPRINLRQFFLLRIFDFSLAFLLISSCS